jgi:hypothetical protein
MPDVTPIYNWPIPEDTDLVKDGAEAIRDLAGAIETTVDSGGDSGLVHIETVTIGSTVSAVNVNDVFTSAYTNYKVIFNFSNSTNTNNTNLNLRLRVSGTDASGGNYNQRGITVDGIVNANVQSNQTNFIPSALTSGSTERSGFDIEFRAPNLAKRTNIYVQSYFLSSSTNVGILMTGQHDLSTAYDGFSLIIPSGTITDGTIDIYGYRKS